MLLFPESGVKKNFRLTGFTNTVTPHLLSLYSHSVLTSNSTCPTSVLQSLLDCQQNFPHSLPLLCQLILIYQISTDLPLAQSLSKFHFRVILCHSSFVMLVVPPLSLAPKRESAREGTRASSSRPPNPHSPHSLLPPRFHPPLSLSLSRSLAPSLPRSLALSLPLTVSPFTTETRPTPGQPA